MINSVGSSTRFTPIDVKYGKRLKYPLSLHTSDTNFRDIPVDCRNFLEHHIQRVNIFRQEVEHNSLAAQIKMVERVNTNVKTLDVTVGDYVYLKSEPIGVGQKFKQRYTGPYVVLTNLFM